MGRKLREKTARSCILEVILPRRGDEIRVVGRDRPLPVECSLDFLSSVFVLPFGGRKLLFRKLSALSISLVSGGQPWRCKRFPSGAHPKAPSVLFCHCSLPPTTRGVSDSSLPQSVSEWKTS